MKLIFSIDIGEHNLGWTLARAETFSLSTHINEITYETGILDTNTKHVRCDVPLYRIKTVCSFVDELLSKYNGDILEEVIIERQVPTNVVAMGIMYALITYLLIITENITLFDPKLKFTKIRQQYKTTNKFHKKQSINNMSTIVSFYNVEINDTTAIEKRDDIADSFNQLIISLIMKNKLAETFDELSDVLKTL